LNSPLRRKFLPAGPISIGRSGAPFYTLEHGDRFDLASWQVQ